jgi:hypothetical protein
MLRSQNSRYASLRWWVALGAMLALFSAGLLAQTTISTGSIQGTVTDSSGAVLSGAKVTITNRATGLSTTTTTNGAGAFASGALTPAQYEVRVEAQGFKTQSQNVIVQLNTTSTVNAKMSVGESTQVVEVQASEVAVNTEQATVQGILNATQIENMPINGRNFLDLAQLEPGIQIQDGGTFDPTKNGFSSISFGGRFGRTARIEVDGIDISDENVGTTTQNIPLGAIQEASLQQSSLDLSTELTSSGSVNVTTKSGTNALHGEAFYLFRDQTLDAALPGGSTNPFQRNQYGGSIGGPILKDKLFFFADAERIKQDFVNPVLPSGPFSGLTGSFTSPFRDPQLVGRLDYSGGPYKLFYRVSYESNRSTLPFIPNSYQPFANNNHSRDHVVGLDFNTGTFTHSIRFGYMKFQNGILDAVTGSSIFDPAPGIELAIGSDVRCLTLGANQFCSGINFLAPQTTIQTNHQIKYDGSKVVGKHIFRFGGGFNHIQGGGFAKFLGLAPAVGAPLNSCVSPVCADPSNPLDYPVQNVILGNGQGFSTEHSAFGLPAGGLGPDNRLGAYFGDSWKFRPNLTITAGLRYVRDTGRTDSDLRGIPELAQFNNQFYSGLQNPVRQPNSNLAPQLGFAWSPGSSSKTVIRGGIGLFYENAIWNNVLFDRPGRLQQGLFLGTTNVCQNGNAQPLPFASNIDPNQVCGQPIGNVFQQIITLQQQYQAAVLAAGPSQNGVYVGNILADGADVTGTNLYYPNYQTPRSVQMNIGIQRELKPGMVLTVDYLRNVATHTLLSGDTNHVGDSRFFDMGAAQAAIATTLAACGVTSIDAAISAGNCPGSNGTTHHATIGDFQGNGLDSGYSLCGGLPCSIGSTFSAAFPGINSALGANQMLFPIGRSVYNGLQTSLRENMRNPLPGLKALDLQVSYSYSRYVSTARDSDFINFAADNRNPTAFMGPNALDRTHQLSFGGTFDLPGNFRFTTIGHVYSPLALNLNLPGGGIFVSDLTGDGTGDGGAASNAGLGDLFPGTKYGAFGRDVSIGKLRNLIANYNNTNVGQPTPAGQVLIDNNLFTLSQLQQLGGVQQPLNPVPQGAVGQAWLRAFDLGLSWGYKFKDRFEVRPGVTVFNAFNLANFDGVSAPFSTTLDPLGTVTAGAPNSTTNPQPAALRLGLGSGVFGLGSPRVVEFALKLIF